MGKNKKSRKSTTGSTKTNPTLRTAAQRQSEIDTITTKLDGLSLGPDTLPEVKQFYDTIVKDYLLYGAPASGSFPLPGCQRVFQYTLSNRLIHPVSFNLAYREDV